MELRVCGRCPLELPGANLPTLLLHCDGKREAASVTDVAGAASVVWGVSDCPGQVGGANLWAGRGLFFVPGARLEGEDAGDCHLIDDGGGESCRAGVVEEVDGVEGLYAF